MSSRTPGALSRMFRIFHARCRSVATVRRDRGRRCARAVLFGWAVHSRTGAILVNNHTIPSCIRPPHSFLFVKRIFFFTCLFFSFLCFSPRAGPSRPSARKPPVPSAIHLPGGGVLVGVVLVLLKTWTTCRIPRWKWQRSYFYYPFFIPTEEALRKQISRFSCISFHGFAVSLVFKVFFKSSCVMEFMTR